MFNHLFIKSVYFSFIVLISDSIVHKLFYAQILNMNKNRWTCDLCNVSRCLSPPFTFSVHAATGPSFPAIVMLMMPLMTVETRLKCADDTVIISLLHKHESEHGPVVAEFV